MSLYVCALHLRGVFKHTRSPLVPSVLGGIGGWHFVLTAQGGLGGRHPDPPTLTIFSSSCGLWASVLNNLENAPEGSKLCHHLLTLPGFLVPSPTRWTSLYFNAPFKSPFLLQGAGKESRATENPRNRNRQVPTLSWFLNIPKLLKIGPDYKDK